MERTWHELPELVEILERFAAACGLYVSDGRDNYSDCHPGELTWERPRDTTAPKESSCSRS